MVARGVGGPRGEFLLDFAEAIPTSANPVEEVRLDVAATGFASTTVHGIEVPWSETVQVGALVLLRPGRIPGRVLDPTGAGLPGATVSAYVLGGEPDFSDTLPPDPSATCRSGEGGAFQLEGIPPGVVRLAAAAEGFAPVLLDPFRLREGEEVPALTIPVLPGATIEGTTIDEQDRPVSGAEVAFSAADPLPVPSASSDAEGHFRIGPVRTGCNGRLRAKTATALSQEIPAEGGARELVLRLLPFGRISGEVRELASRRPCAQASVVAWNADHPPDFGRVFRPIDVEVRTSTDQEGRFELRVPSEREYAVRASMPGFAEGGGTVEVRRDARQPLLGILLASLPSGVTARGRVVDSSGEPPRHALVTVDGGGRGWSEGKSVRARSDGVFELGNLSPGWHHLQAWAPGFQSGEEAHERVHVPAEGEVPPILLTLQVPGGIEGKVRVGGGVPPVPLRVSAGIRTAFTDTDGRFELFPLPPGEHSIYLAARAPSRMTVLQRDDLMPLRWVPGEAARATVVEGQNTYVEIDASDALFSRVHGAVRRNKAPVGGAKIRLATRGGRFPDSASVHPSMGTTTAVDGAFELWTDESGFVEVSVYEADFPLPALTTVVRLEQGRDQEVVFDLVTAEIVGTIADSSGSPLPGAAVNLAVSQQGPLGTWTSGSVFSRPDGSFRIHGLAAGSYVLTVGKTDRATRVERLDLAPLETRDFGTVPLPRARSVPVRVSWADGRMLDRANLRVETEDGLPVPPAEPLAREAGMRWTSMVPGWIAHQGPDHLNRRAMLRLDGGRGEIRHLGPGTWRLRLLGPVDETISLQIGERPTGLVEWTLEADRRR